MGTTTVVWVLFVFLQLDKPPVMIETPGEVECRAAAEEWKRESRLFRSMSSSPTGTWALATCTPRLTPAAPQPPAEEPAPPQ